MKKIVVLSVFIIFILAILLPVINSSAHEPELEVIGKLPMPIYRASTIYDGNNVYIFGGKDGLSGLDTIIRYDPSSNKVTVLDTHLTTPKDGATAVWNGEYAFIFGGNFEGNSTRDILRFDPTTQNITNMDSELPWGLQGPGAFWDGEYAYIYGGHDEMGIFHPEFIRYDPNSDYVTVTGILLPGVRAGAPAVWTGEDAYIFAGRNKTMIYDQILKVQPSSGEIIIMDAKMPEPVYHTSAA